MPFTRPTSTTKIRLWAPLGASASWIRGTEWTTISFPGATHTIPYSVNDFGVVVGSVRFPSDARPEDPAVPFRHGFVYENGNYRQVDYPGATNTDLAGINNLGQIVGSYYTLPTGLAGGFLLAGSQFIQLGFPNPGGALNPLQAFPFGIDNDGTIVGAVLETRQLHGFVYRAGVWQIVDIGRGSHWRVAISNGLLVAMSDDIDNPITLDPYEFFVSAAEQDNADCS